ncbi:MAG: tRNA (cytidine(34)-2'-O)-methyltransferase [Nonlabens sp.]
MPLEIVLVEPEIHTNTGNIGRLCLGTASKLHLVKPLGFELSNSRLKRAGLDYWQHIDLEIHDSYEAFELKYQDRNKAFLSARASKSIYNIPFKNEMMLVFGKESKGLPSHIVEKQASLLYKIPMIGDKIRSLNLANSVAITLYEGLRCLNYK